MRIFFDKEVLPEKKVSQPSMNLAAASASALQSTQNAFEKIMPPRAGNVVAGFVYSRRFGQDQRE